MKNHGNNPILIFNTLKMLKNNRYVIKVFGKKRHSLIYAIGHKVPFHFVKHIEWEKERQSIKIAFDSRIALLFCTAKNDAEGKIIYNSTRQNKTEKVMLKATYGVYDFQHIKQNTKLKSFITSIYMQILATNHYVQRLDLNTFKENYAYKSKITQIKHCFSKLTPLMENKIISKITIIPNEIQKNIYCFFGLKEKRDRLIAHYAKEFENLQRHYENNLKGKDRGIIEKIKSAYKKSVLHIEKQLKRNDIDNKEISVLFLQTLKSIKNEQAINYNLTTCKNAQQTQPENSFFQNKGFKSVANILFCKKELLQI